MSKVYASEVVKIATAEDGYLEKKSDAYLDDKTKNAGNKNYTKYARDMNEKGKGKGLLNGDKQAKDYCALGIIWDFCVSADWDLDKVRKVLCFDGSVDNGGAAAGCKYFRNYFKAKKRLDKNPKVGDVVFFTTDKDADPEHVGLVIKVTEKQIKTQEWNTKLNNKWGVFQKTYNKTSSKILDYGHPKFDAEPEPTPTPPTPPVPPSPEPKVIKASKPASKGPSKELNRSFKAKIKTAIKDAPNSNSKVLTEIAAGTKVRCYGYYSTTNGVDWLYIRYDASKSLAYEGFVCEKNLEVV